MPQEVRCYISFFVLNFAAQISIDVFALGTRQAFCSITQQHLLHMLAKTGFLVAAVVICQETLFSQFSTTASSSWETKIHKLNLSFFPDCHRGQSLIVTAISEGRQAARQIDLDLMGETSLAGPGGQVHSIKPIPKEIESTA